MKPNPLYMLMKDMTQREHGPRPYDGILGASEEKVVAYEEGYESLDDAIYQAQRWVDKHYGNSTGTLIEIRVVGTFTPDLEPELALVE